MARHATARSRPAASAGSRIAGAGPALPGPRGSDVARPAAAPYAPRVALVQPAGRLRARSIARLLSIGLASSLACGDAPTTDGEAPSATGPIPVERFERALAEATCAAAERCDLGSFVSQLRADGRCV